MWEDRLATSLLGFAIAVALLAFGAVGWTAWAEAHDGRRCVETRYAGKGHGMVGRMPTTYDRYECVRWVADSTS